MMTVWVGFLVASAIKALVILGLAGVVTAGLTRRSAAVRHLVWIAGLVGVLLLPALSASLPAWRVIGGLAPELDLPARSPAVRLPAPASLGPVVATSISPISQSPPSKPRADTHRAASSPIPVVGPPESEAQWRRLSLTDWLLIIWGVGTGFALGWIAAGQLAVRRVLKGAVPADASAWVDLVPGVATSLGLTRPIRLYESGRDIVPMTFGWARPVVVVPRAGRRWPECHRRDVLTHELAHVHRHDCLTQLVAQIALAFHWYNPLAWLAVTRARAERELACDDAVLIAGSMPSRYAAELLETARSLRMPVGAGAAGLAMARRSQLSDRLLAVLATGRARATATVGQAWGAAFGASFVVVPLAVLAPARQSRPEPQAAVLAAPSTPVRTSRDPVPVATPANPSTPVATADFATAQGADVHQSSAEDRGQDLHQNPEAGLNPEVRQGPASRCPQVRGGGGRTVRVNGSSVITGEGNISTGKNSWSIWTGADCSVVIASVGDLTFTADESDVASLTSGGSFTITESQGSTDRVYRVRETGGALERAYTVENRSASMDASFERWRAELVLEFIRRSGYDAAGRAYRILAQRGIDGLLTELGLIPNDHARARYYAAVLGDRDTDPSIATKLLTSLDQTMTSDYERGQALGAVTPKLLESAPTRARYIDAVKGINSDYAKRQAVSRVIDAGRGGFPQQGSKWLVRGKPAVDSSADPATTSALLEIAGTIKSDYEVAELLLGIVQKRAITPAQSPAYFEAVNTIESDFEKRRVLSGLLKVGGRTPAELAGALTSAATIGSDYELGEYLKEVAHLKPFTDVERGPFFKAVATIQSDYVHRGVLSVVAATNESDPTTLAEVLRSAATIGSDYELAELLVQIGPKALGTDTSRKLFREALATIESKYERERALAAVGTAAL